MIQDTTSLIMREISEFFTQPNYYRSIFILVGATVISYIVTRFATKWIARLAQIIGAKAESSPHNRMIRYRQMETYLSVVIALLRAVIVAVAAYIAWRLLAPQTSSSGAAAIGASAFFIVIAGQTLGMLLRDMMAGAMMITEGWFHVGDFIKIEPFLDTSGVVERFTLRSTKLRSLSGDVIWVHNQHIQAVQVSRSSTRMYAVDVFTRQPEIAQSAIQEVIDAVPSSTALVRNPIKIKDVKQWNDQLTHILIEAKTAPGREWLIEQFFLNALKEIDEGKKKQDKLFVYEPTARFADPVAEKKFRRSIRS